jgi:hypothetical protein
VYTCWVQIMSICVYKTVYINHSLTNLFKRVKPFKPTTLILYWVRVKFTAHIKNCNSLCRVLVSVLVKAQEYDYIGKS